MEEYQELGVVALVTQLCGLLEQVLLLLLQTEQEKLFIEMD